MSMDIFEIGYRYLIPSIKRMLVLELNETGLSQKEIAERMKISRSAVSRYLSMERGVYIDLSEFSDIKDMTKRLADKISQRKLDNYELQREILEIAIYALSHRYVCAFHESLDPEIDPRKCNICPTLFKTSSISFRQHL